MKEILRALNEEMKRLRNEGEESISLSDESFSILEKLSHVGDDNFSKVSNVKEVKFSEKIEVVNVKKEDNKKVSASISGQFYIKPIPEPKSFKLPKGDKVKRYTYLKNLVLGDPVCNEHLKEGKNVVFGVGNLDAKIFFCGEAPGADEEIQGEPFVGKAGQLLTKIIKAMGLERDDVYIGNIMNWRPELPTSTGNRAPTQEEMNYCLPYLKAQIEIVNPEIVIALGGTAVNGLLGIDKTRKMKEVRGQLQDWEGRKLLITYHPSYLLQYADASVKRLVWEDMLLAMGVVGIPISDKQRSFFK